MTEIIKDGVVMAARDNHQLAAFLNNGWKVKDSDVPKVEMSMGNDENEGPLPFSDNDIEFEERPKRSYTKTEISRMSTEELQVLAAEVGIENAYETSGNKLKGILAEHFGL